MNGSRTSLNPSLHGEGWGRGLISRINKTRNYIVPIIYMSDNQKYR